MRLQITDKITEIITPEAMGKINTKFSRFMTISPGSLKRCIFGKTKKRRPTIIKTRPKIIKNLAIVPIVFRHNG
jgi:hypothetical protein